MTHGNSGAVLDRPEISGYESALRGPFTGSQLTRLSQALAAAEFETGLQFSVYVGELVGEPEGEIPTTTVVARQYHDRLSRSVDAVLIAVAPNQRVVEIVTGRNARKLLDDRACGLAALSAAASFAGGDLAGGIVTALRMLAERARR